jgi:pimeloyl-ACP methyl ester carboxylesterase
MKPIISALQPVPRAVATHARESGFGIRSRLRATSKISGMLAAGLALAVSSFAASEPAPGSALPVVGAVQVAHKTMKVGAIDIFYREAGRPGAPVVVLLHGFPTSSHMFRNLMPALSDKYHVIAPDYPGFGHSSAPRVNEFDYTFDRLADVMDEFLQRLGLARYSLYVMDYGAPIGYRIATRHPERVQALIVQNGNAYEEGLGEFWTLLKAYWKDRTPQQAAELSQSFTMESTRWQYTHGVRNLAAISPDNWIVDTHFLSRPGNHEIQLALFYDYGSNPRHYPEWQAYFRRHQPPTLVVWGKNDVIFPAAGAFPYKRDLKNLEFHLLDTGHFALEEEGPRIAALMREFLGRHVR